MMRLLLTLFVGVFSLSLMAKNLLSNSDFNAKDFQQDIAVNMLKSMLVNRIYFFIFCYIILLQTIGLMYAIYV